MKKKVEVKKENTKKVSLRNYFLVIVVSVLTIAIALYVRAFYINYNNDVASKSGLENINEINMNEIGFTVPESGDIILYVSYTGDKNVYNMEKKLYKEISKKSLNEKVLYLNVNDFKENAEYIEILKKQFPDIADQINLAPMFIYIENGEAVEAMSSELKLVDYKVFDKLATKYELE